MSPGSVSHASGAFLDCLSEAAKADLEARARSRTYSRGTVIFHEDDDGSQVMVLRRGQAKISVSAPSGRAVILHVAGPGDLLGEISAVDGGRRSATVAALTEVELLVLSQVDFVEYLEMHAEAATALLRLLATKLRGTTRRQLEFGTADALGRLCRSLVEFADQYATPGPAGRQFDLPITQQDLASLVGLSREAVVKGLATLRSLGWINATGRTIELLDEAAIATRAIET